jgi:predicted O-methyltransferase YrrM
MDRTSLESPPLAKTEAEKRILAALNSFANGGEWFQNVPPQDGRLLRLLAETAGAKNVVEIGTSTGYSGLWFCAALQATGGKLTTYELDAERAAVAQENFKRAGADQMVTVVRGDAHENVKKLRGPLDVVFIDADKEGYLDYLNKLLPLVRPGGLILAHNVGMGEVSSEYVKAVTADPNLETVFYMEGGGLSVTLKKR